MRAAPGFPAAGVGKQAVAAVRSAAAGVAVLLVEGLIASRAVLAGMQVSGRRHPARRPGYREDGQRDRGPRVRDIPDRLHQSPLRARGALFSRLQNTQLHGSMARPGAAWPWALGSDPRQSMRTMRRQDPHMSHLRPPQEPLGVLRRQADQARNVGVARPFPGALYQPASKRRGQDHAEPPDTPYRRANRARRGVGNFATHLDRHARSRFLHVRVSSQHSAPAIVVGQAEGASTWPRGDKPP
jgi:hypothetical protein